MKKLSGNEEICFRRLIEEKQLANLVPEFADVVTTNSESKSVCEWNNRWLTVCLAYVEMQDLLATFKNPSIMDIKMGVRTYLEEEISKSGEQKKLRNDMYSKMMAIDPNEPSEEEHRHKGVTKARYMIWRESISSTSTLGYRIDGIKLGNHRSTEKSFITLKDFKRIKSEDSVESAIRMFINGYDSYLVASCISSCTLF